MRMVRTKANESELLSVIGMDVSFLCRPAATDGTWSLMESNVPKGCGPPPHRHAWGEAYYIVEGAVDFEIAGESLRLEPGDFAFVPGGTVHAFHGASDRPARMLTFDAPAHALDFFEEIDREMRDCPDDVAKLGAIAQRHGIEVMRTEAAMPGAAVLS